MSTARLTHAISNGDVTLPGTGRIALFNPSADVDLSALPLSRCHAIQRHYPDHEALVARGIAASTAAEGDYAAAVVFLPRARAEAEGLVAEAEAVVGTGTVIVDGAKTDGIETMLKSLRRRVTLTANVAKAHGKCLAFMAEGAFADWRVTGPTRNSDGYLTLPGVFSADGIDPASRLLADALPADLSGRGADLGAGWGYLAARLLSRDDITALHLVEADHDALRCARANVTDPRAAFHWDDARDWKPDTALDFIVTNPPFHTGRTADPGLGRAFLANAARILAPSGRLFVVANRQLPYEETLTTHFGKVSEFAGDGRFKVLLAQRPSRTRR
ncbi:methyltransferase [Roseivivax sp. CAU 1753]